MKMYPRYQLPRVFLLAMMSLVLFGCVAVDKVVPLDHTTKMRKIAVVAFEPPPLGLPGEITSRSDFLLQTGFTGLAGLHSEILLEQAYSGAPVIPSLWGVLTLLELAEYDYAAQARYREMAKFKVPVEFALREEGGWAPTMVAALVAAEHLREMAAINVSVSSGLALIPGMVDRPPIFLMEYWVALIRAWYNADCSSYDYTKMSAEGVDAVLEVGVGRYEFIGDMFSFDIMMKVVDPETGRVLARTRESTYQTVRAPEELFRDDAKPFQTLFRDLTTLMVPTGLNKLGLIKPHAPFERLLAQAQCGVVDAQELVAVSYHYGAGVGQDLVKAATWYKIAADQSSEYAVTALLQLKKDLSMDEYLEAERTARTWQPDTARCQALDYGEEKNNH